MMEYKGYVGRVELDAEAGLLHGEVVNTRDVITFEGSSVEELRQAFEDSVDDYLEFCRGRGEPPDKPFSGNLSLRMRPELHREVFVRARLANKSLNAWVTSALEEAVERSSA
jgi:predicted HicB family RNase H-like nuclease